MCCPFLFLGHDQFHCEQELTFIVSRPLLCDSSTIFITSSSGEDNQSAGSREASSAVLVSKVGLCDCCVLLCSNYLPPTMCS